MFGSVSKRYMRLTGNSSSSSGRTFDSRAIEARSVGANLLALLLVLCGLASPAGAQVATGTVIQTINASLWSPPAPDTAGITYRPQFGDFLTCDSEVDEVVIYAGANIWSHSKTGVVSGTATTVGWSNEPTGIAWDPAGDRLWISDDDQKRIYEIDFGPDGQWNTADDVRIQLRGYNTAGCDDLEDVTFNPIDHHLYIASSLVQEVCEIAPGPNGVFNGAGTFGDDVVNTWSLVPYGVLEVEGIVYDPFWDTLTLADRDTKDLFEFTPEGTYLRKIDVPWPPGTIKPSGVTIAPSSINPNLRTLWVTDRGVDNGANPNENDGRIYEVVVIPVGGNGPPVVDAGQNQTVTWPQNTVNLSGFVSDDGHPYPPSTVASVWSKQSGPGSVTFGNANNPVTTATFSVPGTYVLQLVGNDSAAQTLDTMTVILGTTVTLSTTVVGPGSVSLNPPGGSYTFGQTVNLTATPNGGAGFVGWSGDLSGNTSPQPLLMNGNKAVTATFGTLHTVTVNSTGPGSVTLSPPGGTYPAGTVVTVTATPGANAVFNGFTGALTGTTTPQQLLVNGNKTIGASFTQYFTLSTTTNGPGSVSLSPPTGPYAPGSTVTVTATPNPDSAFTGFSGDLSGTTNPQQLVMNANKAITAAFATLYDVSLSAVGPGSVTLSPPGGTYVAGTVVTVTATPGLNAVFSGFSGALSGTTTPQLLTVDADKSVGASFTQHYTVSVNATGPGTVTLNPPTGPYAPGTVVTVTATPGANAVFNGFTGALTGTTSPQPLTVDANKTVGASFTQHHTVSVNATGPGTVTLSPPTGPYAPGTVVTVTATPGANAVFNGFTGALSGTTSPQQLTVDADKMIGASFTQHYTVSVNATGPGSVTLSPPTGPYAPGTVVTVTATPGANAVFNGFTGALSGTTSPQQLTVDADKTIGASFTQHYAVSVNATGPGSVTLSPPTGPYAPGTIVTVTATPGANAVFDGFTGALSGTTSPQQLTVDADKTVGASFTQHFTVALNATGPGTLTIDPPIGPYAPGTLVTVTATPGPDAGFLSFSGDLTGTTNPAALLVDANKSVTAAFATLYDVSLNPTGPGTLTLDPPGGTYLAGTVVSVTATPGTNAVFGGFSGALSGTTSPQLLTVDADKTVGASFTQHYVLSVTTTGPGSVTLSPPGGVYAPGTLVTLSAFPGANAVFGGWSGALTGTANPAQLTINADTSVSASFTQLYTVTATAVGPGSVTLSPPTGPYPLGSVLTVTATPGPDAAFLGFSGDLTGTTNPATLIVDGNESVTATFATLYDVSLNTTGPGTLTLDPPGGTYVAGTVVAVTATPGLNAMFNGFSGALSGTTSPQQLTVDADKTVGASFTQHYTVSVTPTGPGSVTLSPPGGIYPPGTLVTFIAVPNANAVFSAWGGALTGDANPETLVINANAAVSASFTQLFTVATAVVGPGSVTLDPPVGPYAAGTAVTLTAVPDPDSVFQGWSGDLSGSTNPATLIVDGNESVTATFARLYDVTLSSSGPGTVTLDPPGGTYVAGTVVSVTATAGANAVFDGFTGDLTGTASPQQLTVDADKTVGASFTQHYTVSVSATGPGAVTLDPPTGPYAPGTLVTVTATPDLNAVFDGFTGDLAGTTSPQQLTVDADKTVGASFTQHYTVSVNATGPGAVTLDPPTGPYAPGTLVTVTATPDLNAVFDGFTGDLTGTASPQQLTVDADKTVGASFTQHYTVSVNATGPGAVTLDPPTGPYAPGALVSVTATPDLNAVFDGFTGDLAGTTSPQQLTVDADKTVGASFTQHYTVSVSATGPGAVTLDPPAGPYAPGALVTVTATPDLNAVFDGFTGDLAGTTSPQQLTVDADKTVGASFTQHYTVSVSATGPGAVTLDPPTGPYAPGTLVTVTATPDLNAVFDGFTGDLAGTTSPQQLTVDADKTVGASFTQHYTVSVSATGPGAVTLDPPTGPYAPGTLVTVTATPDLNAVFDGFTGDLAGTASPQQLTVDADKTVGASFTQHYTVSVNATGPGAVTLDPPTGPYAPGTLVTVTATPDLNAVFDGFTGDLAGTTSPQQLTVDADKTVGASFTQHYTVSVNATGPGAVTLDPPAGPYAPGTLVTVTATPDLNAVFDGFTGDLTGTASPQQLTVDADKTVGASFTQHYTVSVNATGPGAVTLDPPTGPYAPGTLVTVTATPDLNAVFDGFTGDLAGTTSPQQLTVDADKTVGASFSSAGPVTLTVTVQGGGTVTLSPQTGPYPAGSTVTLTPVPTSTNWMFNNWSGDAIGNANPLLVVMTGNKAVHATFTGTTGGGGGSPACGIGPELVAALPLLAWLHRRRRRTS